MVDNQSGCFPRFFPARLLSEAKTQSLRFAIGGQAIPLLQVLRRVLVHRHRFLRAFGLAAAHNLIHYRPSDIDLHFAKINIAPL